MFTSFVQVSSNAPVQAFISVFIRHFQLVFTAVEKCVPEELHSKLVHTALHGELRQNSSAIVRRYTQAPQKVVQMRVVAVAEEGLRVLEKYLRIKILQELDLIVAADRCQHRLVLWITEGGHHVS